MKSSSWVGWAALFASMGACRGTYLGEESCGGMSNEAGQGTTMCPVCPVCPSEGGAGGDPSTSGGASGRGGAAEGGAAGGGGQVDACALLVELPEPSFHVSFTDCSDDMTQTVAQVGRPAGTTITGTRSGAIACVDGPAGKAIQFIADHSNPEALEGGAITFAPEDARPIDLEHDATIAVWIRQDTAASTAVGVTTGAFGRWYYDDQFALTVRGTTWTFEATYSPDPLDSNPENDEHYKVSTSVELGEWTHLALVMRRGGEMRLLKNGRYVPQGTAEKPAPVTVPRGFSFQQTTRPLVLGHMHDLGWDPYYDGAMDELRLYRAALSDEEVALLSATCP